MEVAVKITSQLAGTAYEISEPDEMHPCVGWYYESPLGYVRGPFPSLEAAAKEAADDHAG